MRIRIYHIDDDPTGGGGGDNPKAPTAPKGYAVTTPQQRTEWNGFLDYVDSKKGADLSDPKDQAALLSQYKKANPDFSIAADKIPDIQHEAGLLRSGNQFGNLGQPQMDYLRQGMSTGFLNRDPNDISGLRYPVTESHGTDLEGYYNAKIGLASTTAAPNVGAPAAPATASALPIIAPTVAPRAAPANSNLIPPPDYNNQASRTAFLQNWQKKYGSLEGRGDTVLKVNEVPRGGSDTAKNMATKIAGRYGLDPALLYSSSMEEGMSGLFKNKNGTDTKGRKPGDFGYQDNFGNKEFPINGNQSFGLPDFYKRFPELVKGGYLPKEFASRFKGGDAENNFKTADDALTAKAAIMKYGNDYVEKIAQKNGVDLSPKQKDFFTLAWFNGGEGAVLKRIPQYKDKGYLKDDKFLDKRPVEEQGKTPQNDVYGHVVPRLKMRDNLKEQQLFN